MFIVKKFEISNGVAIVKFTDDTVVTFDYRVYDNIIESPLEKGKCFLLASTGEDGYADLIEPDEFGNDDGEDIPCIVVGWSKWAED